MEMNDSTPEQSKEASKTTATVNAFPKDATLRDVGKRKEQLVRDRAKGTATAHSGGRQDDPPPHVGGSTMSADTTSPKHTKKLRTKRDVSLPRERARSKTRATKPWSDEPSI
jgi:hypothetical protein